jgi:hypothetical protein
MILRSASSRVFAPLAIAIAFVFFVAISPVHVAAQTVYSNSVQTKELLPPGQNTCPSVAVTDIEPHVYGGVLESFDVTISDTSNTYVGILGQVGNTSIPLNYITRWAGSPNGLRIHVDTPDMTVGSGLPVSLTLLASPPGAPTCVTSVSFNVSGSGIAAPYSAPATTQAPLGSVQNPITVPTQTVTAPSGQATALSGGTTQTHTATSSMQSGSSTLGSSVAVTSAANERLVGSVCGGSNAYRLWFILLIIYILIVGIVVFTEPWFLEDSVIGSTAAILIPLILLLAFWYFSAECRAASWIPVLACVIAIIGLFLAFREYETMPLLAAPSEQ